MPAGMTLVRGDGQLRISYLPPTRPGGVPVTGYSASCNPGGFAGTASGSPMVINGLANGTAYTCTVTASNSVGNGTAFTGAMLAPSATAFTGPAAFIAGSLNPYLEVLDTANNQVVAVMNPVSTVGGVSVAARGSRALITNGADTLFIIDPATNFLVASVYASNSARGVAVTADGSTAYVAGSFGNTVSVVDVAAARTVASITVDPISNANPSGIALRPDGSRLYVANSNSSTLSVVDTLSRTVVATVPVGSQPQGVGVTPQGNKAYVANSFSNTVSVVDLATNTVTATVPVGLRPQMVAFNPAGTRAYVTNQLGGSISVIDTASNTVTATVSVGVQPFGIAVNTAGTRAYVTTTSSNLVPVVDLLTNTVVTTVTAGQVGTGSFGVFIRPAAFADAPSAPTAVAGIAQATVSFTAPAFDGGTPISGYTVTSSPGNITGTGSVSPITVTGLTNGTTYTFTVAANNTVGTGPASAPSNAVTPKTVPGAPIIGTATRGNAQVTVAFSPPVSDGGATITGYTVTSNPGGITATGTASPIVVTGLANGTGYTFTVTATNSAGTSAASSASNSVTPATVPGAPTIGTATAGDRQATITFTAPSSNGGAPIHTYTAVSSPGGFSMGGTASPLVITGLANGTAYTFTVTATNSVGTGPASAASNSVTPSPAINPPGAPTITTMTSGNARATIAFVAPASNGGSAITSYTVSCVVAGTTGPAIVAAGTSSPITVTGLTNGLTYSCSISAANAAGSGTASAAVSVVPSLPITATAAIASNTSHTLALDVSGKVFAWGDNTFGQLGDGTTLARAAPVLVPVPAAIKAIAVGERFSVALDSAGNVWGWGDNRAGAFGASLVSRTTPQLIAGVANVQAIAAGGPGLVLYLMADGSVRMSGTLPGFTGGFDPAPVAGLTGIVGIAAGSSAYAIRNDGRLFAWGGNAFGELGNGSTNASAAPVQVQGISTAVTRVAAANNRASAVTSDGKVWSWGKGLLGNGLATGSPTPVQVAGISDAADIALGSVASFVRRSNGALLAWGNTGLAQVAQSASPVAVPFFEPVHAVQAGAGHSVAFIIGRTGLTWGFGFHGSVSQSSAAIGDGTYVPRETPVVLLAPGGSGAIDRNDWYLDLDAASAETIPSNSMPTNLGVARLTGTSAALTLEATVKYKAADFGKAVNNYAFGLVPPEFFAFVKSAPDTPPLAKLQAIAKDSSGYLLAQYTPQGWAVVTNQLTSYSQSTGNAAGGAINLLDRIPASNFPGARFCIGYGESSGSMLSFQSLSEVLNLEGARGIASNVPCVLTGIYVEGPAKSRAGSEVTFSATVVGLLPKGTVQFRDGTASLQGAIALESQNDAVAKASIKTSTLTVGPHPIGATYSGDVQNAAAASAVAVKHDVEAVPPGESRTVIAGPASSTVGATVVFTATITGDSPSGSVQFKDNGTDIGEAVALPRDGGGVVSFRTAQLGVGTHSITASYSGNSANQPSSSSALSHTVAAVPPPTVTLTASSGSVESGSPVTLTASVSGQNVTGSITFRDGSQVLGTASVVNGVATLTLSALGAGAHAITADYYASDSTQAVSSSGAVFVSVTIPGDLTLLPGSVSFGGQSMSTTAPPASVMLLNTTSSSVTVSSVSASAGFAVTHDCTAIAPGASCRALVTFTPATEGSISGTLTMVTSAGTKSATLTGTGEKSLVTHYYRSILRRAPDEGGKAHWESEAARVAGLGANINETWFALALTFYTSSEYLGFNRNPTEYVRDLYNTFFNRAADDGGLGYWTGLMAQGLPRDIVLAAFMFSPEFTNFARAIFGNTQARAEVDTVVDFYRGLLTRLPDSGGFNYWVGEFRKAQCKGPAEIYAQVEAISSAYANSPEYTNRGRTNTQYMGDIYNAFLRRGGDLDGVKYWINQLDTNARTRDAVRREFIGSPEFSARVQKIVDQGCLQP